VGAGLGRQQLHRDQPGLRNHRRRHQHSPAQTRRNQQYLSSHSAEIRDLEKAKTTANQSQLARIRTDVENLEQDRAEFEQDLRLVTLPFGINVLSGNQLRYGAGNASSSRVGADSTVMEGEAENEELKYILYFSIAFGIIEIIIIYAKYDFLNVRPIQCS
jgi:hypothetical protein